MRSIRYRILKKTRRLLEEIAEHFALEVSFVIDLYALLSMKGNGVPSDDRVKKMVKHIAKKSDGKVSEMTAGILLRKRIAQLKQIIDTALFKGLSMRRDKLAALRDLIQSLQDFGRKARQAQCQTCKFLSDCDFGKQYKDATLDITKVFDPDYKKKVHDQCPVLPDIDKANQLAQAAQAFSQLFSSMNASLTTAAGNQDPANTAGRLLQIDPDALKAALEAQAAAEALDPEDTDGDTAPGSLDCDEDGPDLPMPAKAFGAWESPLQLGDHSAKLTGNNLVLSQALIQQISVSNLALFEIGRKFSLALDAQKRGKFKPVTYIADSHQSEKMKNLGDLTKLESSQHGLPEEVFEQRLVKKNLTKREEVKHHDKKQLLYLLQDSSGSMSGWFSSRSAAASQRALFTRCGLSMVLAIALSRRVEADGGIMFFRAFDTGVSQRISAHDAASFEKLRWEIANSSYTGGGTRIVPALQVVRKDIVEAAQTTDLAKAEILLISDIEDRFPEVAVADAVKGVEFNVLDVSGSEFNAQGASGMLKKIASHYYKANEGAIDINKLVELI